METSSYRPSDFVDLTNENLLSAEDPEHNLQLVEGLVGMSAETKSATVKTTVSPRTALQPMNYGSSSQQKMKMPPRSNSNNSTNMQSSSTSTSTPMNRTTPPRPIRVPNSNSNAANPVVSVTRIDDSKQRKVPKNPAVASPSRRRGSSGNNRSVTGNQRQQSYKSFNSANEPHPSAQQQPDWQWVNKLDPDSQEQALFEQRLCEDTYGVAVRKIDRNGKSQLRYVKCVTLDTFDFDDNLSLAGKSVTSLVRSFRSKKSPSSQSASGSEKEKDANSQQNRNSSSKKALTWGKKKEHKMPLDTFVCVRKGKTTERTKRNAQPATRLLSLVTKDKENPSLDIEAPTRLDRDKFARAFARFLKVPLDSDEENQIPNNVGSPSQVSAAHSAPDLESAQKRQANANQLGASASVGANVMAGSTLGMLAAQTAAVINDDTFDRSPSVVDREFIKGGAIVSGFSPDDHKPVEEGSIVSSLTGAGYDQEIVEELHNALTELRSELETSRAEAARAVKVAEQAIQSAENSTSKDWNSTVTHKAAEAAALAQKKSAEAMAKARLAEERLAGERKTASFWRKQAEAAEEEAGVLQTRAAAAEVQRSTMAGELESERQKTASMVVALKGRFSMTETHQREAIESALQRNRALEIELDGTRRDLSSKSQEAKVLKEDLLNAAANGSNRKFSMKGKKKSESTDRVSLLGDASLSSSCADHAETLQLPANDSMPAEDVLKLQAEFAAMKLQFELLKRSTADELNTLPEASEFWTKQAGQALASSKSEITQLRERLALESTTRRKLLNEVQDLRGNVRVYCRPKPTDLDDASTKGVFSLPSNEVILMSRDDTDQNLPPLSFEYDHVFNPSTGQKDIYSELEEVVLSVLDGYNICMMTYGPSDTGKTYTMLGDVKYPPNDDDDVEIENYGLHLQGVEQLFSVSDRRSERYQDSFFLTLVEVHDEKICDMVVGTTIGENKGVADFDINTYFDKRGKSRRRRNQPEEVSSVPGNSTTSRSGKSAKLEIRSNTDGETVVQGLVTVQVSSIDEVLEVWKQSLTARSIRLNELGMDADTYASSSHMIATLRVASKNVATGIGSFGKIQFVDLAGADLVATRSSSKKLKEPPTSVDNVLAPVCNKKEWKFVQKSISTLGEVVTARGQYSRTVPYRNSTLTHLLSDSLEGDTKVVVVACVSSVPKDIQETSSTLRFASKARRVNIGKATKHAFR